MTNETRSTLEDKALLHHQLAEQGRQPELLLKAIGLLDGDIDTLRALLTPIQTGTTVMLHKGNTNLTGAQVETLLAMQNAVDDIVAALDNAQTLTSSISGYTQQPARPSAPRPELTPQKEIGPPVGSRFVRLATNAEPPKPHGMTAFLTAEETVAYLGLPLPVVQSISTLRPIRVNDQYLYRTADVERFSAEVRSAETGKDEPKAWSEAP